MFSHNGADGPESRATLFRRVRQVAACFMCRGRSQVKVTTLREDHTQTAGSLPAA